MRANAEQPKGLIREATADWDDGHNCLGLQTQLLNEGFASLHSVTDADDIRNIRAEIISILNNRDGLPTGSMRNLGDAVADPRHAKILEITSPSALRPRLLESSFFQRALDVSRRILGSSACLLFDHFITKPPHNAEATAWHQDAAYNYHGLTRSRRRLHWWLPLQAVDMANGCMQFVPKSHLGRIRHHVPRSDALKTDLPIGAVPVACPLGVGDATIHVLKTLHCAGPNNSDAPRHAWIVQIGVRGWIPSFL